MKRIIWMVLSNLLAVPWLWFKLCYYAKHKEKYTKEQHWKMVKTIDKRAIKGGRLTLHVEGVSNLPKKDGYVLFPNHQGMFDVLALIHIIDRPFSMVAKKELENVAFLKEIFKCTDSLCIDREDVRQSMGVIMEMTKRVKAGDNFLIFPEGTRSRKQNEVLEFKGGSFKSATKAKCPIVPVTLYNCYQVMDTNSIKKVDVGVHILPPIEYEEYKDLKTTEIAEMVRGRIVQEIARIDREGL